MASFAILFFFAVTGLTLNHTEWFAGQQKTVQTKGLINKAWLNNPVAKLEVVEFLRKTHGVKGALTDFRVEESQCAVSFKGPGYTADTSIDRQSAAYEITETRMGLVAIINDLHKGRDSGKGWSLMIDVSAVLMCLVSLSGILLILFLQKRRVSGLLVAAAGAVLSYIVYVIWVP